ncbi:NUDIX domain-containing protein [Candidatus Micrarchaeota archaeon]|nr:NUDIX domain-containing protein [Candidatus Micrarchaeota archaeon]
MALKIVVGGLVVKEGKLVLVQEGKNGIRGLWNLSLGGLEENEEIKDGAKREVEEETYFKVELEKLIGVYQNPVRNNGKDNVVKFIFLAKILGGELKKPSDLLEVKWVSFDELLSMPDETLRDESIKLAARDYLAGKSFPTDLITAYKK